MKIISLYLRTVALALLGATLILMPVGCTQSQVDNTLNKIASELPVAQNLANIAGTAVGTLDPAAAPAVTVALAIVNSGLPELQTLITTYTSNPSSSVLAKIETLINSIVSNGNQALYAATHIENAATRNNITVLLSSLSAALVVIDGFIQQIEPASVIQANAASRQVKLSMVEPYLNHQMLDSAAQQAHVSYPAFLGHETAIGY